MTGNRYVLLAVGVLAVFQLLFTYLPAMQAMSGTTGPDLRAGGRILFFGLLLLLIVESEKLMVRRSAPGVAPAR